MDPWICQILLERDIFGYGMASKSISLIKMANEKADPAPMSSQLEGVTMKRDLGSVSSIAP